MQVRLKTTGVVAEGLPEGAEANGALVTLAAGATLGDLLDRYGLDAGEGFLVMVGEEVIVPSDVAKRRLNEGDLLTILPPLRGG